MVMRKFFTALVVIPLGLIFIIFAVANRHLVTVSFDPFNSVNPSVAVSMPLFVVMAGAQELTVDVQKKIVHTIRSDYSPRHVPDEIIVAPDIPYTISGKKTETPVKKVLMGKDARQVVNLGALRNPESIDFFAKLYETRLKGKV